jgi:hypothetical protein
MVKYQNTLCENPLIWLEAVMTLNLATLFPVDSGQPEHDCSEIMDEVFSSWTDLTNQPIGHAIWMLNISQMAAALSRMHVLC